jgi:hypothetical protein
MASFQMEFILLQKMNSKSVASIHSQQAGPDSPSLMDSAVIGLI